MLRRKIIGLGLAILIATSSLLTIGCSSTVKEGETKVVEVDLDKEIENVKKLLIAAEKTFNEIINEIIESNITDNFTGQKLLDKSSSKAKEISDKIDAYLDKELWKEESTEYKALLEIRNSLSSLYEGLQKYIEYIDSGKYSDYKEFTTAVTLSKEHYQNYVDNYKEELGIAYEKKEEKASKEIETESSKETETAVCYDCGKNYPLDKMTFNGRSYHCGCDNEYCEDCKKEIPYGEEVNVGDNCFLCKKCYKNYQSKLTCEYCSTTIKSGNEYNLDGQILCEGCYNRIMLNRQEEESVGSWICPNCGNKNYGEVLCECEMY